MTALYLIPLPGSLALSSLKTPQQISQPVVCSLCLGFTSCRLADKSKMNNLPVPQQPVLFLWGLARAGGAAITFPKGHREWGGRGSEIPPVAIKYEASGTPPSISCFSECLQLQHIFRPHLSKSTLYYSQRSCSLLLSARVSFFSRAVNS